MTQKVDRYGLAVDIGTTNIKMAKISLADGLILMEHQRKNAQRIHGKDVMARIQYACDGGGEELKELVREDIRQGMEILKAVQPERIAIACNTTMMALLCGDSVDGMKEYPFQAERLEIPADETSLIAPAAGPFIGGDIVAGLQMLPDTTGQFLFIDLGTNGEMVLGTREKMFAVSVAAGPAFEYMVDASGSMLLEVLQEAYEKGLVDETGLLSDEWFETGYLWKDEEAGKEFLLTQKKIRDLQLAKAAVRTGVDYLLQEYEKQTGRKAEPEQIYLAGGMGVVSEEACIRIGMLPEHFRGKCKFLGNTALQGAILLLCDTKAYAEMKKTAQKIETHTLAAWSEFNDRFVENINFPANQSA